MPIIPVQRLNCRRQGSILVCVIVCISIATSLIAGATQSTLRARRQMRVEREIRQAELLMEAGVDRAISSLLLSADYQGETWTFDSEGLPGFESAQVKIAVTVGEEATARRVRVDAVLPLASEQPTRCSLEFEYLPPASNPSPEQ